ncbi:hypothetical protein PFISCL1PPCAC_25086 [Pristionchus fissidentatus]|uniref:TBC1 domain family member 13 n=1 Tax=Pristionchus fissidentatus TaxID=1538716 RepID=A0AAV5WW10_9BILA|nr:hypothetical protein PFISCL1PPCAC_25086 [Pristionchus fissidentatus]
MSARYHERFAKIESILLIENKIIDKDELKASCSYGVPDRLRPLLWRLLLEYLPTERATWTSFLASQRATYDDLVRQMIVDVAAQSNDAGDPLSDCSHWGGFFADNTTLAQIDKDVRRLCPEIQFFQQTTKWPHSEAVRVNLSGRVTQAELKSESYGVDKFDGNAKKRASAEYANATDEGSETHWQVAERILFIYAKLNPGVKYVQGMNEVLGPIYYVLATDPDEEWAEHAEADTFFCFQQLMSEIKDNFIKTLDDSQCGIEQSMSSLHSLLCSWDPVLHAHLVQRLQIRPQFYAFRWLSLMLSQEFPLPDVIGLWDALFADAKRFTLLPFVCISMLQRVREQLLRGDFADCIRLLQNYPETDAQILVMDAYAIREGRASRPSTVDDDSSSNGSGAKKNIAGKLTDKLRSTINLMMK